MLSVLYSMNKQTNRNIYILTITIITMEEQDKRYSDLPMVYEMIRLDREVYHIYKKN